MKLVENPYFKKLLVGDSHLYRIALRATLFEPRRDQWDIIAPAGSAGSLVKWLWSPVEVNGAYSPLMVERLFT